MKLPHNTKCNMLPNFATDNVWAWHNRKAARNQLKKSNQTETLDMAFLLLRGLVAQALHSCNYTKANDLLQNFCRDANLSKKSLKNALKVIGVCITTGTEEFDNLHKKLKENKLIHANKKQVRKLPFLRMFLVEI